MPKYKVQVHVCEDYEFELEADNEREAHLAALEYYPHSPLGYLGQTVDTCVDEITKQE
jgi:hypothetical protein